MSSTVPYIGSKISLVSNSDIRYEGILYTINTQESTIALQSVRCCGTEGRKVPEIPPSSEIYDFIIFRGQDIKDLTVLESANPALSAQLNDPAIMSVNQRPQGKEAGAKGAGAKGAAGGGKGSAAPAPASGGYGAGRDSYSGKGASGGGYGAGGKGASQSQSGWGGWGAGGSGAGAGWSKGGGSAGGYGGGAWGGGYGGASGKGGKDAGKGGKDSGKGGKDAGKGGKGKDAGKGGKASGKDAGKGSAKGGKDAGKGGKAGGKGAASGGAPGGGGRRGPGSSGKGSSGGGDGANGTPVGELLPSINESEKAKYNEEFNYEAENAKFDKNTLKGEEVEEKLKPLSGYNKATSFFDSISCEATERAGDAERPKVDRNKARQNDRETFGDTRRPPRPTGGRRGKGGGGGSRRG